MPETPSKVAADSAHSAKLFRSAGIMSVAVATSRITGLVRETLMARWFGASQAYDAFALGFRLPNLTRDLFAEGALSSAFVPTFTEYLAHKDKKEAAHLANLVGTAIILIVGLVCVLGFIFAPTLVQLTASGWKGEKFDQVVHMTRIMFPFLLLVALAAQAMGMLNACNRFGVPAMSSTMFNIGSIVFGVFLGRVLGPSLGLSPIDGMAWGVVFGGALQLLWQIPSLYKLGFPFRLAMDWSHPGLRHIIHLMGPAILGGAAVQINVMVNTNFATLVVDPVRGLNGPVSWLGWAFRFMQLPLGLFGVAIASATLPAISRSIASGDRDEFKRTLSRSLGMVFLLTVPSSVGLVVLGRMIIAAVYEGGKFNAYDTQRTALALSCYAIGLAGYAASKVLNPAYYALKDSRTPMWISIISIAVNYAAARYTVNHTELGHAGLALSTSAVALFSFVCQFWILRNRIHGIRGRALAVSFAKVCCASALMGIVIAGLRAGLEFYLGTSRWPSIAGLVVCLPAGLIAFWMTCRALRVPELDMAAAAMPGPMRRLLRA